MASSMTIDQILWDLNYCDGEYPEAAFQAALERRDEIIPVLIELIEDASGRADEGERVTTWGHIGAMFLLTEFGAKEGLPVILSSMRNAEVKDLYGNFITDSLPSVAARLADSPEDFEDIIDDCDDDDEVRGALLDAVFGMVCDDRVTREAAIEFVQERLSLACSGEDVPLATRCVEILAKLVAKDAQDDVNVALRGGLLDTDIISRDYFREQLAGGEATFVKHRDDYKKRSSETTIEGLRALPWFNDHSDEELDLDRALLSICEPFTELPVAAIRWARKHPAEITPHLIHIIEGMPVDVVENFEGNHSDEDEDDNDVDFYDDDEDDDDASEINTGGFNVAMYLLTEFNAKEALPAILRAVGSHDWDVPELLIDILDYDLAQMLGRLADSPDQLKPIFDDLEVYMDVRGDMPMAVVWMVTEGKLERIKAIKILRKWLEERRSDEEDNDGPGYVASALLELGATETRHELLDAWEAGALEDVFIEKHDIIDALSDGDETFARTVIDKRADRIEHTVVELQTWNWSGDDDDYPDDEDSDSVGFDGEDLPAFASILPRMLQHYSPEELVQMVEAMGVGAVLDEDEVEEKYDADRQSSYRPATIRNADTKVGRNDPCPCGSGKKYKKCCAKEDQP
ncbi:MAG: DUF1186 domain-containing protein [Fuerstia sp.]|nr:DUF1186 domain-containing protein [Fuerstiella sp.]